MCFRMTGQAVGAAIERLVVTIGERLKAERERSGLTQKQLAEQASVTQGAISLIEGGKTRDPGVFLMSAIARALGQTLDVFISPAYEVSAPTSLDASSAEGDADTLRSAGIDFVSELLGDLAATSEELARLQPRVAALEGVQRAETQRPHLSDLVAELLPILQDLVNGHGNENQLRPRVEAIRVLGERDHGVSESDP